MAHVEGVEQSARARLDRLIQLMPATVRPRVEQHLQRREGPDPHDLQSLVAKASRPAAGPSPEQPPSVDRTRLDKQWREVAALVQRIRETAPWQQPS
jgi:hypothetical protein